MAYDTLATPEIVERTIAALKTRNVQAVAAGSGADALEMIKEFIPKGASIMNGSSRTLEQIGFVEYLKSGAHGWDNLHEAILAQTDRPRQMVLRKQAVLSDWYLGSVHALAQTGQFVIASNTGSQLPHVVYTSPNLLFVVSTKKIVPTLADAMLRLEQHVIPLEDENMRQKFGVGTEPRKIVIFNSEHPMLGRTVRMILVNEDLGF